MSVSVSVLLEGMDTAPSFSPHVGRDGRTSVFIQFHNASIWGYDAEAFRRLADCAMKAAEALDAAATPPPAPASVEPAQVGETRR